MKKQIVCLALIMMLCSLSACGSQTTGNTEQGDINRAVETSGETVKREALTETEAEESEEEKTEEKASKEEEVSKEAEAKEEAKKDAEAEEEALKEADPKEEAPGEEKPKQTTKGGKKTQTEQKTEPALPAAQGEADPAAAAALAQAEELAKLQEQLLAQEAAAQAAQAAQAAPQKTEVQRTYVEDCGMDSGYWVVTYSDGSTAIINE